MYVAPESNILLALTNVAATSTVVPSETEPTVEPTEPPVTEPSSEETEPDLDGFIGDCF